MVILPLVNLNGTSREALVEQSMNVATAIRQAIHIAGESLPHGRDYPGRPELYVQARGEHERRSAILEKIAAAYEADAEAVFNLVRDPNDTNLSGRAGANG